MNSTNCDALESNSQFRSLLSLVNTILNEFRALRMRSTTATEPKAQYNRRAGFKFCLLFCYFFTTGTLLHRFTALRLNWLQLDYNQLAIETVSAHLPQPTRTNQLASAFVYSPMVSYVGVALWQICAPLGCLADCAQH